MGWTATKSAFDTLAKIQDKCYDMTGTINQYYFNNKPYMWETNNTDHEDGSIHGSVYDHRSGHIVGNMIISQSGVVIEGVGLRALLQNNSKHIRKVKPTNYKKR